MKIIRKSISALVILFNALNASIVPVPGIVNDIQIQSNGNIVASGYSNSEAQIVRYTSAGDIDTTFGNQGIVQFSGTDNTKIFDSVLQTDQKIVVVGSAINTNYDLFVARLLTDGTFDSSFGTGGIVVSLIGQNATAYSVGLQSDGKIVVAGTATISGVLNGFIARYTTSGVLDTSFGTNGITLINQAQGVALFSALVVQGTDAIIVAGFETTSNQNQLFAARFLSNGAIDTSFGVSGYRVVAVGTNDNVQKIISSNDGSYILTGSTISAGQFVSMTVKVNSSGNLVSGFGSGGIVLTNLVSESYSYGAIAQPDGKIVIAGGSVNQSNPIQTTLLRYTSTGSLDSSFGNQGVAITSSPLSNQANTAFIQPDGKIVVAGSLTVGASSFNMVARFTTDGLLDNSFGVNGVVGISNVNNATGATGTTGAQGNRGATGNTGPRGFTGNTGSQGPIGFTGATGPIGFQGSTGNTGLQGVPGTTGSTGNTGAQGIQGTTGNTGPRGIQGVTGNTGSQGLQGTTGNTGLDGIQGPTGNTGPQGIAGATGTQGNTGPQGNTGTFSTPNGYVNRYANSTITLSGSSTWTNISFPFAPIANTGWTSDNTTFTCQVAGVYEISYAGSFLLPAAGSTYTVAMRLVISGDNTNVAGYVSGNYSPPNANNLGMWLNNSLIINCSVGTTIVVQAAASAGAVTLYVPVNALFVSVGKSAWITINRVL